MYFITTEWLNVATERDLTEKYSKKLTPYGGVPGLAAGAHMTVWVNAVVPRLFFQLLIDKHLSIYYSYTIGSIYPIP